MEIIVEGFASEPLCCYDFDEQQLWGWSNSKRVHLQKGENQLILNFSEENVNMNKDDINRAMLDQLRVIRLSAAE